MRENQMEQMKTIRRAGTVIGTVAFGDPNKPPSDEFIEYLRGRNKELDDYAKGCYSPSINIGLDSCTKLLESIATRKKEKDDACAP